MSLDYKKELKNRLNRGIQNDDVSNDLQWDDVNKKIKKKIVKNDVDATVKNLLKRKVQMELKRKYALGIVQQPEIDFMPVPFITQE